MEDTEIKGLESIDLDDLDSIDIPLKDDNDISTKKAIDNTPTPYQEALLRANLLNEKNRKIKEALKKERSVKNNPLALGNIVMVQEGNPYHEWVMWDYAKRKGFSITTVEVTPGGKELVQYRFGSLFEKAQVLNLKFSDKIGNAELIKLIKQIKLKNKLILVNITDSNRAKAVESLKSVGYTVGKLPSVVDYGDKVNMIDNLLTGWKVRFDDKDTKKLLIKLMIKEPESWTTVRDTIELFVEGNREFNMDVLGGLFPEQDFFKLNDYFDSILQSKTKWKVYKQLNYFLNVKQYSPNWLMGKLRDYCLDLDATYLAYRKGILSKQPLPHKKLAERIDKVNIKGLDNLLTKSWGDTYRLLDYVDTVPYSTFVKQKEIIFNFDLRVSQNDWYLMVTELKKLNGK